MTDFDIPVEDFEALLAMIEAGDLSTAENRFRELTKASRKDAQFFVREMAAGNSETKVIKDKAKDKEENTEKDEKEDETDEEEEGKGEKKAKSEKAESVAGKSGKGLPEPDLDPEYSSIPLPVSESRPDDTMPLLIESKPEPAPPKKPPGYAGSDSSASPGGPKAATSAPGPVKPPETLDAKKLKKLGRGAGKLRWYERMLPVFSLPLLWGGLLGALFCGLGSAAVLMIFKSSPQFRARRYLCAILALAASYTGYLAVVGEVPREFSLLGFKLESSLPEPIEPSNTQDWNSPAASVVAGTDAELQAILDLRYQPMGAFPPVSTKIGDATLIVVSEDVRVDGPLAGVPLLEEERDLVADIGRGFNVTLDSYALRLPWDEPGAPLAFINAENPASEARKLFAHIPIPENLERPLLRCSVRFNRGGHEKLAFHLFDARTGRKISSAGATPEGLVDFDLGIWHATPLLMVVEADAWASSPNNRRPLPAGKDVTLGLGRVQVAYAGPGRLEGVENGATIEPGKAYSLVGADDPKEGGMVIVRYAPPYLAGTTSLLMVATTDYLASRIPAFGDFELKPVGASGDGLGFRVFHIPPTIDNSLQGDGLNTSGSRGARKVERTVNYESDRLNVAFQSQRGRGLIALEAVAGLLAAPEGDNLFDLKIPRIVFEEGDSVRRLLEFAADAVEFGLEEADGKGRLPYFSKTTEYEDLTPRQALLDFEQLSGIRVLVDGDQRRIRLQR